MAYYIINKNTDHNGKNEVHNTSCEHLPFWQNQVSLGWHANASSAVIFAKSLGWCDADGCYHCCSEEHKG